MKKTITFLISILCVLFVHGQQPVSECAKMQYEVDSLIGANQYRSAAEIWAQIKIKCSPLQESFYTSGEKILRYKRDVAMPAEKSNAVSELFNHFDEYDKKYPDNKNGNTISKAVLMHENNMGSRSDIYLLLDKSFKQGNQVFSAEALYLYFDLFYERFLAGQDDITAKSVLQKLDEIHGRVLKADEISSAQRRHVNKNLLKSLAALTSATATCDNLISYYSEVFEKRKSDTLWLETAGTKLLDQNCTTEPIFAKISERAHDLKPTAASAYNRAIVAFRANNYKDAAKYFDESATLNPNPDQKAAIYYTIASTIYNSSDRAKAKEYAQKAVTAQPTFGKAYFFLSQLYGSSGADCGATPFEVKAINWLAAETALKAGVADPKYKGGAEKMAQNYNKKAPTDAEVKDAKMAGKQIAFKCWINETVMVPKN